MPVSNTGSLGVQFVPITKRGFFNALVTIREFWGLVNLARLRRKNVNGDKQWITCVQILPRYQPKDQGGVSPGTKSKNSGQISQ